MKTVKDHITGRDVDIDYHPPSGTAIMACNGVWLEGKVMNGSKSLAQVAFTKGDLEAFGSFFE